MKSLFIIFTFLLSAQVFAAGRIPTSDEDDQIVAVIKDGGSLRSLIDSIKSGDLEPQYDYYNGMRHVDGISSLFRTLIYYRFDPRAGSVGDKAENLELLKIFLDGGVNLNVKQPVEFENSPADAIPLQDASISCSAELVNILLAYGADPKVNLDLWLYARHSAFDFKEGTPERENCTRISETLLSKMPSMDGNSIFRIFAMDGDDVSFIGGENITQVFSPKQLELIKKNFGVSFNTLPRGDIPDDAWFDIFMKYLHRPGPNDRKDPLGNYDDQRKIWWDSLSAKSKEWSCYYSTLDESLDLLLQAGYDKDELTNFPESTRESVKFRSFGSFAMNVFRPYCDSLKH